MKKLLIGFVFLLTFISLVGCVNVETTTTTQAGTTTTTTTTTSEIAVNELPEDDVTISFWHIYGQEKSALLDAKIAEFEAMYPNVTIESTSQTDYNTLRQKINQGIAVGQVPTMAIGYPDHFAGYVEADAALPLDTYINSDKEYEVTNSASSIFGDTVSVGIDLSDFVQSYLDENNQYQGGYYYSVPFSKSTETMAVNRDVLKAHVAEIRAAGITISDEGFLSHDTPLTFEQVLALRGILVDTNGTNPTTMQCEYLLNYDSAGNLFINMSRQWRAGYTNPAGNILIDNDTTKAMLQFTYEMFQDNTLVLPIAWDQSYGSTNFMYGDVCMSVGSTAGVSYNIPSIQQPDPESLQLGMFDVDFVPVPQFVAEDGDSFTVSVDGTDETFTGSLSAVQQGPNIGIFKVGTTEAQRLYAWLFIKYLIQTDNTAEWAMNTGYLPARLSSYSSTAEIDLTQTFSITYSDFLQIAQDFWDADGDPGWAQTDERWDYLYSSMVANVAKAQNDFYQYDPAFAAGTNSAGSATARVEAGACLENIYVQAYSPTEALNVMLSQLTW